MTTSTPPSHHPGKPHEAHSGKQAALDAVLLELARCDEATALARLDSRAEGLNEGEIAPREIRYGPNQIARTKRRSKPRLLLDNVRNPLVILLLVLAVSFLTGDYRAAVVMLSWWSRRRPAVRSGGPGRHRRRQAPGDDQRHATVLRDGNDGEMSLASWSPGTWWNSPPGT